MTPRRAPRELAEALEAVAEGSDLTEILGALCHGLVHGLGAQAALIYEADLDGFQPVMAVPADALLAAVTEDADWVVDKPGWIADSTRFAVPLHWHDQSAGTLLVLDAADRDEGLAEAATFLGRSAAIAVGGVRALAAERRTSRRLAYLEALRRQVIATVAHDLRLPLTVFRGVARVLRTNWDQIEPGQADDLLASVERQASRLTRLSEDLLDAARIDADVFTLYLEDCDLADVVRRVLPDVELEVTVALEGDVHLRADAARVERIVWNLLTNAQRYGDPPVVLHVRGEDAVVVLDVRDHGPGLTPERRVQLGESFGSSDDPASVGLGLAIVKELTEAHGGSLCYEDARPGARFVLTFPKDGPGDGPARASLDSAEG